MTIESVLFSLRRRETDIVMMVQTCLKFSSLAKQSQFVFSLRANSSGSAGPNGARIGEGEVSDAVAAEKAAVEGWDLDGVVNATGASGSGLLGKFCEL